MHVKSQGQNVLHRENGCEGSGVQAGLVCSRNGARVAETW